MATLKTLNEGGTKVRQEWNKEDGEMKGSQRSQDSGQGLPGRHAPTTCYAFARRRRNSAALVCSFASLFLFLAPHFAHGQGGDPARGEKLINALGCLECHTINGVGGGEVKAPEWVDVFGKTEELEGGETVIVDEAYLRESIQNPDIKVVKGYPAGKMPPKFKFLPEEDLAGMVAYIKSLSVVEPVAGVPAADGASEIIAVTTDAAPPGADGTPESPNIVMGLFAGVAVCAFVLGACPSQIRRSTNRSHSQKKRRFLWPT